MFRFNIAFDSKAAIRRYEITESIANGACLFRYIGHTALKRF